MHGIVKSTIPSAPAYSHVMRCCYPLIAEAHALSPAFVYTHARCLLHFVYMSSRQSILSWERRLLLHNTIHTTHIVSKGRQCDDNTSHNGPALLHGASTSCLLCCSAALSSIFSSNASISVQCNISLCKMHACLSLSWHAPSTIVTAKRSCTGL